MSARHVIIPIFIPHKGCPFDCIYCNQKSISGECGEQSAESIISQVLTHLSYVKEGTHVEIAFYGGSFTGIERDLQIKYLEAANRFIKEGTVEAVRISTRPDYINSEILGYLSYYNVKTIELGVQSLDEKVLEESKRGHNIKSVYESSYLIKSHGFTLGIQTMTGLPGDTPLKAINTAKKVIGIGPQIVRIYPLLVIRNTYLEKLYKEGRFIPQTLDEAVELCSTLLFMYEKEGINVIRMGLQTTENINEGADVVAGPFHPAFRQLVESRLMLRKVEEGIKGCPGQKRSLTVYVNKSRVSDVVGHKKANIEFLKKKYGFIDVQVKEDESLQGKDMKVKFE